MGKLENEAKKIRTRANIQKIVLQTIAAAGFMSVALLAPNALRMLSLFDRGSRRKKNPLYLVNSAFEKLVAKGFVSFETVGEHKRVRITPEGKLALAHMIARSPDSRKHKRWDKRWRMVIYDIREEKRRTRVRLQETLRTFGFQKLQASVWVYPYECEELVTLLKADFKIGSEVLYVIVERIEHDTALRRHFGFK